jgi:uncharacterized membrane protein YraQ (UPF0718 family)
VNGTALIINALALVSLVGALIANRQKALAGLKKGGAMLVSIAPVTLLVVVAVGILLAFIPPDTIGSILGEGSGISGILIALGLGALVHMPALLGFPLAGTVLNGGGAVGPVAAFITSLTMIGIFTIPMEMKILGKRFALLRNSASAALALLIALALGALL